jgi:hypothetical protein
MSGSFLGGVIGATIGFAIGGPGGAQEGWLIGATAGGILDPPVIKGQRLTDAQGQTATDGVFRPIVYGIAACAGNVIQIGPLVEHKHKQSSGKGGPVQITYTYTRTYAIRICEGPISAILRVWRNDKLIYDATASGVVIAADSATTASKMTFYLGDETQMPSSILEALPSANGGGAGNVCAHRGTAYAVIANDDLTDMQGAIPQYKWEVRTCIASDAAGVTWIDGNTGTTQSVECLNGGAGAWMIGGDNGTLARSDDYGQTWSLIPFTAQLGISSTSPCQNLWFDVLWYMTNSVNLASSLDGGETWQFVSTPVHTAQPNSISEVDGAFWAGYGTGGNTAIFQPIDGTTITLGSNFGIMNTAAKLSGSYFMGTDNGYILKGASLGACASVAHYGGASIRQFAEGNGIILAVGDGLSSQYAYSSDGGSTWSLKAGVFEGVAFFDGLFYACTANGIFFSSDGLAWTQDDSSFFFNALGSFMRPTISGMVACTSAGKTAAAGFPGFSGSLFQMPDSPGFGVGVQGDVVGPPTTNLGLCSSELSGIVADLCARCGVDSTQIDVSALTDDVRGFLVGAQIAGKDAIKTLQQGYFFDFPQWDKKLRGVKRSGAPSFVVNDSDLLIEDDNDTTTRAQAIEFPRKLNLIYADPTKNYAATTQTAERRTEDVRAIGELTVQLPLSLISTEAAQIAAILLQIAWTEAEGKWKRHLPEEFSQMTPSDIFTTSDGRRYRALTATLENDETLFEAVRDRVSSYSSSAAGSTSVVPIDPVSSMKGPTIFAAMNLPRLNTQDNSPGMYIAVMGLLAGWIGCDLQLSTDAGVSFHSVAQLMTASTMGRLTGAIGPSTTPIPVEMYDDGQLDSVTDAQLAARANGFAIVASDLSEVGQFKTATSTGVGLYDLTTITRGALGSTAASHAKGDQFVMLDNVFFLQLDASLAGQTLIFRPVSIGTPAATNATYSVLFDPQFTGPAVIDFYEDETGAKYADETGAYYQVTE